MAEGLSVSLPLRVDPTDGAYGLNKTLTQMAAQNLRMIILTAPGERVMSPSYGVGVRHYLFEQNSPGTISGLRNRISKQISTYLPYIQVMNLEVASPTIPGAGPGASDNTRINISIRYRVPSANIVSDLTIPVTI